jgi:hypothetical protein
MAPHHSKQREGGSCANFCSKCAIDIALKGVRVFQIVEHESENGTLTMPIEIKSVDQIRDSDPGSNLKLSCKKNKLSEADKEGSIQRENEIKRFLERIETIRKSTWKANQSLERNKRDIRNFYEKQIRQVEDIVKAAQEVLEKKKEQVVEQLFEAQKETFSRLGKFESSFILTRREIENINSDIVSNMEKILNFMELEPFKLILLKYKERVEQFDKAYQGIVAAPISLSKVAFTWEKNEDKQLEEEVLRNISNFFEINTFDITLHDGDDRDISNKIVKPEVSPTVISFNNKEIFENALKASLDKHHTELLLKAQSSSSNDERTNRDVPPDVLYDVSNITEIKRNSSPFYDRSFISDKSNRISLANKSGVESSFINPKEEKENETPRVGLRSNNNKYINLLEKISQTQENTSKLYTNIIKNNPALSPEVFREKKLSFTPVKTINYNERSDTQTLEQIKIAQDILDDKVGDGNSLADGSSLGDNPGRTLAQDSSSSLLNKSESVNNNNTADLPEPKREDNRFFGNFMNYIETRMNDDRQSMFQDYQRSLFCSENISD